MLASRLDSVEDPPAPGAIGRGMSGRLDPHDGWTPQVQVEEQRPEPTSADLIRERMAEAFDRVGRQACRVCGCTDDDACLTLDAVNDRVGCSWVEPDLCSACVR